MAPPVEYGNSCNHPAYCFIHDSINRLPSLFFSSIHHDESQLLFDEVVYCKESDEAYEPLTSTIEVDENCTDYPHNERSYRVEFLVFSKLLEVKVTSVERSIDVSDIKDYNEKEKPERIGLDCEILGKIKVHYPCKHPHKEEWGKEEETIVGTILDIGDGHEVYSILKK